MKETLSVKKVAALLEVKPPRVIALIQKGELFASDISVSKGRATWRIRQEDLDGFLLRRQHQPPAPRRRRRKPQGVHQWF